MRASPASDIQDSPRQGGKLEEAERAHLIRNCVLNCSGVLASGLLGVVTVPLMLARLGAEPYGLLLAVLAISVLPTCLETGLSMTVTRELASRGPTSAFLSMAATAYLAFAVVGSLLAGVGAYLLVSGMHFGASLQPVVAAVILLACVSFAAERVLGFSLAVLAGLHRFDILNAIAVSFAVLRSGGLIALLLLGGQLRAVALWYAVSSVGVAMIAAAISLSRSAVRVRLGVLDWAGLKPALRFGIATMITNFLQRAIVDVRLVIVALLCGATGTVALSTGQKFPFAVSDLNWRAAETLLPASAKEDASGGAGRRALLHFGTRYTILLVVPASFLLLLTAPTLLRLWLGRELTASIPVMRLTCVAVLLDGCGLAALQVLWGAGRSWTVLRVYAVSTALALGLTLALVPRIGVAGAAWGLAASAMFASIAFLVLACRDFEDSVLGLLRAALAGMAIPIVFLSAAAVALYVGLGVAEGGWIKLLATLAGAGLLYVLALYRVGMTPEERAAVRRLVKIAGEHPGETVRCYGEQQS